jgi:hypothetical protein
MKMPKLIASTARLPHIAPSQPDKTKSPTGNNASILLLIGTNAPLRHGLGPRNATRRLAGTEPRHSTPRTVGTFTTARYTVATEKFGTLSLDLAAFRAPCWRSLEDRQ